MSFIQKLEKDAIIFKVSESFNLFDKQMEFLTLCIFLKERELAERRMEEEMEAFKRQIIEEERQKLLKEHAMRLLGYLPKVWRKYSGKITCCMKGGA